MKHIVRVFVAALVLTGAIATTHASTTPSAKSLGMLSATPAPACPPDGGGCGW